MTPTQPPKIAAWMLKHFGSGADNEALLGDLAEQYQQKRSAIWYWRQVIQAIPVSLFKEVRGHREIAARALLTGWIIWIIGGALIFPLAFFGTNIGYDFEPRDPIGSAWSFMWMPVLGLYGVERPLALVFAVVLPFIVGTICGWLVARGHRDQRTSVVLLFAGSVLLIDLLLCGPFVLRIGPAVAYYFAARLAANFAASVLGVVFGGGLLRDRRLTEER